MMVPNAGRAYVVREKITEYLLSPTSPRGRAKEAFFTRFGFRLELWQGFAEALRYHCEHGGVVDMVETPSGTKYAVVGTINTPDGRDPTILTVWQTDHGSDSPRFITAYPRH